MRFAPGRTPPPRCPPWVGGILQGGRRELAPDLGLQLGFLTSAPQNKDTATASWGAAPAWYTLLPGVWLCRQGIGLREGERVAHGHTAWAVRGPHFLLDPRQGSESGWRSLGSLGCSDPTHSQLVGCGPHSPQSLGVGSDASFRPPFSGECYKGYIWSPGTTPLTHTRLGFWDLETRGWLQPLPSGQQAHTPGAPKLCPIPEPRPPAQAPLSGLGFHRLPFAFLAGLVFHLLLGGSLQFMNQ